MRSHLRVAVCWNLSSDGRVHESISSHLRVAVCWNQLVLLYYKTTNSSHLRVAVCWNNQWLHHFRIVLSQPPSGGCVLKLSRFGAANRRLEQPPSGGCVLKRARGRHNSRYQGSHLRVAVCWNPDFAARVGKLKAQPPSGGCVLKLNNFFRTK